VSFHTTGCQGGIDVPRRLIIGRLIKDQFVIGDSNPGTWFKGYGHNYPLIVHKGSIATAKVHYLVLKTVVTAHNRVLPRYVISW